MRFRYAKSHTSSSFTPSPAVRERGPGGEGRLAPLIAGGGRARERMEGRDLSANALQKNDLAPECKIAYGLLGACGYKSTRHSTKRWIVVSDVCTPLTTCVSFVLRS